ncbi:MAG: NAD(P)H-hydrate dehydratase, partial [Spirochaetia bacterium]|nr:NAD(P)H-hydrate dehydratase [Spirochaetia bacterium]
TKLANIAASSMVSGSGVVKLAVPSSLTNAVSPLLLESTLFPLDDTDGQIKYNKEQIDELLTNIKVLAFGIGIGSSAEVDKMLSYILSSYSKTLLIDADGLNSLSKIGLDILRTTKAKVILTPHTKEMSRLSGYSVEEILQSPINITKELALKTNSIILLKGPTTIITDGSTVYLSSTGCAGMAKAGSGDVLSGVIAAICSYNEDNLLLATAVSAFITGYAGEIAEIKSSSISMLASDTVANIKDAISILVNNGGKTST